MRLWIDDVWPAPDGYIWCKDIETAIYEITRREKELDFLYRDYVLSRLDIERLKRFEEVYVITEISCDNDLGENEAEGYKLLNWLELTKRNYPIRIHSANPVARERMRAIIKRNNWKEVF